MRPMAPLLVLGLFACNGGEEPVPECVPAESVYTDTIHPIVEAKCGECHGTEPAFGAPFSLVEGYDDLVAGEEGVRKSDQMLDALLDGRMPEESGEPLTHTELDTLVGWLSCGTEHPDPQDGLVANRDIWEAPANPPADTTAVELTADEQAVGVNDIDVYREYNFSGVVSSEQFIRRIEPIVDEDRVIHHITLTRGGGFPYYYAWAPGTQAIEFPDGGIRINESSSFRVEIHYNNGAGIANAVDSSGVRLWVGEPTGTEYGMMSPVSWNIYVPPGGEANATQDCTVNQDFTIVAGMPHMHEIGDTFDHDVIRSDGTVDNLISLTGWSFEAQYFYEMGVEVNAGDRLLLDCGYANDTNSVVTGGLATSDEMCFDFLVVTPASAATQCAQ